MTNYEDGQLALFAKHPILFLALFAIGGLVIDGGLALAAKRRAFNEAQAAARAGANQISEDRYRSDGSIVLDHDAALAAAMEYLRQHTNHSPGATVEVPDNATVKVTVHFMQPMTVLGIGSITSLSITGNGSARTAHGVVSEGQ